MSKQRKQEKKRALAKQITTLHLKGEKGPARTTAVHGKKKENTLNFKRSVAYKAKKLSLAEKALQK